MSGMLGDFRQAVIEAAKEAMQAMQLQMVDESFTAIQDFQWEWKGPISDSRSIIDTGNLMNSIQLGELEVKADSIGYTLTWDPVDPGNGQRYADLVHYGNEEHFETDEDEIKEYTARPWTFLLIPEEDRDEELLNTDISPSVDSLPDDGWKAAMQAFDDAFKRKLSTSMKVIL